MSAHKRAAAVALLRPGREPGHIEVFLIRRPRGLRYLGGFHTLPGGTLEPADGDVPASGCAVEPDFCSGLCRELLEELGVLLAGGAEALSAEAIASMRRELVRDPASWPRLVEQHGLRVDAGALVPMGRWLTPAYTPVRYEAHYFAAWLPPAQRPSPLAAEVAEGLWLTPAAALTMRARGELFASFQITETLAALAAHGADLEAAGRDARARAAAWTHPGGEMIAGVHLLPLRSPTLPPATHTNTYVLGGRELVVVDPASPYEDEQELLLAYLRKLAREGGRCREIWLSHHHPDHIGAAARLRTELGVPIAAHRLTAELVLERQGLRVDRCVEDGEAQTLELESGPPARWRALHTPGHAPGHLCFQEERSRALLTGDNVLGSGTAVIAPPRGNMGDYVASLERLLELRPSFLFPGHGPPTGAAEERIRDYLAHRREREASILAAIDQPLGPAEIVTRVYNDVPAELHGFAEMSVRAHLEKLVGEGRVREVHGRFVRR